MAAAAFTHLPDMHHASLKPKLLHSLLKDQVPDDAHQFRSPFILSSVVSSIKAHGLLSECVPESANPKLAKSWKSAVDAWVDRLLSLVSSNLTDKCWAGVCLLGVTCQECSSGRFLSSNAGWFDKLLEHLQKPGKSHVVKVASLASVSDLLTRLGGFPNVMKDGTLHAGKVLQPCLKLLNEDSSEGVSEGAVYLLCTLLTFFPSSVRRHYDIAEDAIYSKILNGKCGLHLLEKLGHCLALLSKSRGDEACWSVLMDKILLQLNSFLNYTFEGVEGNKSVRPLGKTSVESQHRADKLSTASVSSLMVCCCKMLTSASPFQVAVHVRSLLSLVQRILMVDGSVPKALSTYMDPMQQEFICLQLPTLHSYSLELLSAIIKAARSQLLTHAADFVRLLKKYFSTCRMPELRIKVYSVIKILLISMGVGIAMSLGQVVASNAFVDLDSISYEKSETFLEGSARAPTETLMQQPSRKKRKHFAKPALGQESMVDVEMLKSYSTTPIVLKIAALGAVESLLTVGGALKSEPWRSKIDLLLISVTTDACKKGWAKEENVFIAHEPTSSWTCFQLSALRALLASLLSPAHCRPPYLVQGLELFRRGKQETGTKIAEFCAHAVLALEILIHPRALPLLDLPFACKSFDEVNQQFQDDLFVRHLKHRNASDSDNDELYLRWRKDETVNVGISTVTTEHVVHTVEPAQRDPAVQKNSLEDSLETRKAETSDERPGAAGCDVEMGESQEIGSSNQVSELIPHEACTVLTTRKVEIESVIADRGTLDPSSSKIAPEKNVSLANGDGSATIETTTSSAIFNFERTKGYLSEKERDGSPDSIPDIVEADPDSDIDSGSDIDSDSDVTKTQLELFPHA